MKWLLLGAFGEGALEHYYVQGLRRCGINISMLDIISDYYSVIEKSVFNKGWNKLRPATYFSPVNKKLETFIDKKFFDVIIVFKGMALFADTIKMLKQHANLLCCYNPDHPFKFFTEGSGNKNILDSIRFYDIYLTYSNRIANELRVTYNVNASVIPFGYDDEYICHKGNSNIDVTNKWLFIGSYDKERASFLNTLGGNDIYIYGDQKWKTRTNGSSLIQNYYQGRALYGREYKSMISEGQGIFNLLRRQNIEEQSHNMRTFEVPGYGGVLITNRTEEQMFFFEEDKEAIYFDSVEELKSKLYFLSKNPHKIGKIKLAAFERSKKSGYGYTCRSRDLYHLLNKHLL
jgi:hypothetical protein